LTGFEARSTPSSKKFNTQDYDDLEERISTTGGGGSTSTTQGTTTLNSSFSSLSGLKATSLRHVTGVVNMDDDNGLSSVSEFEEEDEDIDDDFDEDKEGDKKPDTPLELSESQRLEEEKKYITNPGKKRRALGLPLNLAEEEEAFFRSGCSVDPQFEYENSALANKSL
jgi:hypothetical protein